MAKKICMGFSLFIILALSYTIWTMVEYGQVKEGRPVGDQYDHDVSHVSFANAQVNYQELAQKIMSGQKVNLADYNVTQEQVNACIILMKKGGDCNTLIQ